MNDRADISQEELDKILAEHELMRRTLEIIAGNAGDRLQETQARGALANIGAPVTNGDGT